MESRLFLAENLDMSPRIPAFVTIWGVGYGLDELTDVVDHACVRSRAHVVGRF